MSERVVTSAAQIRALALACEEHRARVDLTDRHDKTWTLSPGPLPELGAVMVGPGGRLIYARHIDDAQVRAYGPWRITSGADR